MFRARRAHHQERQIVSIQLLVTVTEEFVRHVGHLPRIIAGCTVNRTLNAAAVLM
jgi:hypothetical protein